MSVKTVLGAACCVALGIIVGATVVRLSPPLHKVGKKTPEPAGPQVQPSVVVQPDTSARRTPDDGATSGPEDIVYSQFYAEAKTGGLTPGKQYMVRAVIGDGTPPRFFIHNPDYPEGPADQLEAVADFESDAAFRDFLASNGHNNVDAHPIVASIEADGLVHIQDVLYQLP